MKCFFVLFILLFCYLHGDSQHFKNYLKCEVVTSRFKIPLTNGKLSEWRQIADLDSTVKTIIIFDFIKRRMIWDVKAKVKGNGIDPTEEIFQVKDISEDTAYSDFGISILKFTAINEQNYVINYELIGNSIGDCSELLLIDRNKISKSKTELNVIE